MYAPVAQLDRAQDYESWGRAFESLRVRFAVVVLAVCMLTDSALAKTNIADERAQQRQSISRLYKKQTSIYNWYYRLVFLSTARLTEAKVYAKCEQKPAGSCSHDEINQTIHEQIKGIGEFSATFATYSVALACIALSAYGGSKFNEFLAQRNISAASKDFIRVFIPIVTGIGVFSVGAPLWDPAKSFIRRWAFANNQFSGKTKKKYPSRPELESHWLDMQKYFSVNAQISRNTISAFLVLATPTLQDARHALDDKRYQYAAAQIAKSIVQMRYIYSEIPPDQPILVMSVRSYLYGLDLPNSFLHEVFRIAVKLDPLQPADEKFYASAIRAWFDVDYYYPTQRN